MTSHLRWKRTRERISVHADGPTDQKGTDPSMSGHSHAPTTAFGPRQATRLELMGIRFNNDGGDGSGAGGTYTPPATQADLDAIIQNRVARAEGATRQKVESEFAQYKDLDLAKLQQESQELATLKASRGADENELTQKITAAEQRAVAAEAKTTADAAALADLTLKLARYEAAAAAKIPLDHAPRLIGSTKDELEADAKAFKASLRTGGYDPGQGQQDGGAQEGAQGIAEAEKRFGKPSQQQ